MGRIRDAVKKVTVKEYGGKDRSRDVVTQDTPSHHFGRGKPSKRDRSPHPMGRPRW